MEVLKSMNSQKSEKPNIPKIFHGDFIVQTIMNKHKNGPIKKVKMELLMYIDLLKIQI